MDVQGKVGFDEMVGIFDYLKENFRSRLTPDDVARGVCLSPAHFQRMFTAWAGVRPETFLQYTHIGHAKRMLRESTVFDSSKEAGFSGAGSRHDIPIKIEAMTPDECKNGGEKLEINYDFAETPFGETLVAATRKGLCYMIFADDRALGLGYLRKIFPRARYRQATDAMQQSALSLLTRDGNEAKEIKLHVKGTDFQLKVWNTLLEIPKGQFTTYGKIALQTDHPKASRAVGSAVGDNPVAVLVPCHRVIRGSGELGGYRWGLARKIAMIGWESTRDEAPEFSRRG
jgi:AraC family transcriptional regulator of adaptative response/methylated-DNA-[protein]-cysteine methyltransferase